MYHTSLLSYKPIKTNRRTDNMEIYKLFMTAMAFGIYTNDEFFEFIDFISNELEIANALGYGY